MKKRCIAIMISVFVFSLAITLIDAFVQPNYFVKIPIKILFFLALPMLFFIKNKDAFKEFKNLFISIYTTTYCFQTQYVVVLFFFLRNSTKNNLKRITKQAAERSLLS